MTATYVPVFGWTAHMVPLVIHGIPEDTRYPGRYAVSWWSVVSISLGDRI